MAESRKYPKVARAFFGPDRVIEDADRGTFLVVTDEDVERGVPGDPTMCVLAFAGDRLTGREGGAMFYRTSAYLDFGDVVLRFSMPKATREFVEAVDAGEQVEPDRYWLDAPTAGETLKSKREQRETDTVNREVVGAMKQSLDVALGRTSPDEDGSTRRPRAMMRGSAAYLEAHGLADSDVG